MKITFFKSAVEFREWLKVNHAKATELWVGFYKKASSKGGITYAEALDEALCFGWIDGVRKTVDEVSYTNRFSPRKHRSIWSHVNTRRAEQLRSLGRITEAGLKAFERRDPTRAYSVQDAIPFDAPTKKQFKSNKRAWTFFRMQPRGYQRVTTRWIMSAKRDETRASRLQRLIAASAKRLRLDLLTGKITGK
ncbi:MAG TPA: YdeI/OmpD-associated family protein [Candidatus Binatia bacterium]|nr:YdeI/OmpD-associated family protein [Candidatus Binatia bacterium]